MAKKANTKTAPKGESTPDGEYKVGQIVRYTGKDENDLPFKNGDLVKLDEEDKDGFIAIPIGGDPEDGVNVYLNEIEAVDDDEAEEAEHDSKDRSEYDTAKVEAANDVAESKLKLKVKAAPTKKAAPATKVAPAAKVAKADKVEKVAKAEPEPPKELILTKAVQEALKGKSAVNAARALVKAGQINDFNLGGVLAKIQRDDDHVKVEDPEAGGFYDSKGGPTGGFARFVEQDLGIKYGKARYLIRLYETFSSIKGVDEKKLAAVGYSKAKEILDVVEADPTSANKWLTSAKDEKLVDLQKSLVKARETLGITRTARGTSGSSGANMTTVKFRVFNDQAKIVEKAIEKAKTQIQVLDGDSDDQVRQKCLVHIFTDWMDVQG